MALAPRLAIPVTTQALASPSFNPKTLGRSTVQEKAVLSEEELEDIQEQDEVDEVDEVDESDLSPTLRSISPDSLMNTDAVSQTSTSSSVTSYPKEKPKKPKNPSRAPIATGISTTIPVTGEKPRPEQKDDVLLEDDVLFAIFVILYEKDPSGSGMTVKQICDVLVEQHPAMANLLTKTSNLVSAKLNAYVKRVEKGDNSLKYALLRDWADALPKRMVYVYRGLLAEDFHVHAKKLMEIQKHSEPILSNQLNRGQLRSQKIEDGEILTLPKSGSGSAIEQMEVDDPFEAGKQVMAKPRRQTMYDLGITKHTFFDVPVDKSNLFVPYLSAPVTASLNYLSVTAPLNEFTSLRERPTVEEVEDVDFEDLEVFDDTDEDSDMPPRDLYIDMIKKNGKRSKSLSYLSLNKKIKTAAAAAPRALRAPCSHSPNAAAAAAALHASALKAILNPGTCPNSPKSAAAKANRKWLNVIRSGFLSQDIGAPEDTSLSDLDKFF